MNIRTKILIISDIAVLATFMVIFATRIVPSPPAKEMKVARVALANARGNGADKYSSKLYHQAIVYYDSAMIYWRKENRRFIYSRDYTKISFFADLSAKIAGKSSEYAKIATAKLKTSLGSKIKTLNEIVSDLTRRFNDYPLSTEIRNRISKGKFLLKEAEIDFRKNQFLTAEKKIRESEYLLTSSYENANENLKSYFRLYPEWKKWIEQTIAESRDSSNYSIIIDKFSRKVIIYLNGTKQCEYSAELGKNWVGDKKLRGDKATPEGMYKIVKKFKSDSTKYYKALLLNYPNDEDTANFEYAKAKGFIPKSARIGGMIEIHGNGGKGTDWTEGCIALTDKEMDKIFNIAKVGTPVTIVGSTHDLGYVLNR